MIVTKIQGLLRPFRNALKRNHDWFLNDVSGIVHIGANTGQERTLYEDHGLGVIWVEPIPEVFTELNENLKGFANQRALNALVTDVDDKEYQFHIANNKGLSSSILNLKEHKDIWPDVTYTGTILLKSITLASLFKREQIDPRKYQALVMDTQGSELLILRGSLPILEHFKYVMTEVPDFESYEGCCQLLEVDNFMTEQGYQEFSRRKFASRSAGGSYFDIVYRRLS